MIEYADIVAAAERIAGVAHHTPAVTSRSVDERTGASVFLKAENLQRVGAFKFRGAYNKISRLSDDELRRGVVTVSSGNHAQAVALAATLMGTTAKILMPQDAPAIKVAGVKGFGGEVVPFDRYAEDRSSERVRQRRVARHAERPVIALRVRPGGPPGGALIQVRSGGLPIPDGRRIRLGSRLGDREGRDETEPRGGKNRRLLHSRPF